MEDARPTPGTPFGCLDLPKPRQRVEGVAPCQGWVLDQRPVVGIEVELEGNIVGTFPCSDPRDDVLNAYPEFRPKIQSPGFMFGLNTTLYANGWHLLGFYILKDDKTRRLLSAVEIEIQNRSEHRYLQQAYTHRTQRLTRQKIERIMHLLTCPRCLGRLARAGDVLICSACSCEYQLIDHVPILIGEAICPWQPAPNSPRSMNPYPPKALELMEVVKDGLILDFGSDSRLYGVPNLVQLEIQQYPFVDVVSQSKLVPFADQSFDLVTSFAVTEHVKEPWTVAKELYRVLKTGGYLLVDCAFLQPIHAYPSHYFAMTAEGLRELFSGLPLEIVSLEPAPYQHPFYSIAWILEHFLADLPPAQRDKFGSMQVEEFVRGLRAYCDGDTTELRQVRLSRGRLHELAAGFTMVAMKTQTA